MQKTALPDLWQYRISDNPAQEAIAIGDMFLEVGDGLQVTHLTDLNGTAVGVLLGFPIDLKARRLINRDWQSPFQLGSDPDAFVSETMRILGGRFLWIFRTQSVARIYPDCSAQVPCVFDPAAKQVGSTAYALLETDEYDARFDAALFDELGVDGEGWFPAGLTAHHGLHRLLPNHYLDLDTWAVQRFWSGPETTAEDPARVVEEIIEIVQAQIEALVNGPKRVAMALTAGTNTRTLIACARDYIAKIDCMTIIGGDRHEMDSIVASRIAKDMGLNHIKLDRTNATDKQKELFIKRGGHCNGDSNALYHPSVWPLAETHVFVGGAGGEIAYPSTLKATDTIESKVSTAQIIARLGLPRNTTVALALERRLADMGDIDVLTKLGLVYLEDRYAAWYAPQFCCDPTLLRLAPLLTTRSVELMMQLPAEWRQENRLGHEIIARLWPELAQYPYNSLGKWRDMVLKLRRAIANPQLVLKVLRKMRG
ncbi:hypothetical protein EOK75_20350 (plasmid) [Pseudorhodobacter turbinis]|uniref:Asparagine synthetase domain-containing protein n=1 Tax=Pseudorhodobacter turbinis TaxID=2500533 RepID=A0A4P8EM70_9RHOB|nr:hypothetical protein [Pseudorhodobacter turbinis]QCO58113.1 hypothetical protein EOK75_20350 [Pseudorhodobacter turbinis]